MRDPDDDEDGGAGPGTVADLYFNMGDNPVTVSPLNIVALELGYDTKTGVIDETFSRAKDRAMFDLSMLRDDIELPAGLFADLPTQFRGSRPKAKLVLSSRTRFGGAEDGTDEIFCGLSFMAKDGKSFSDVYMVPDPLIPNDMWRIVYEFAREADLLDGDANALSPGERPDARKNGWRSFYNAKTLS